MRATLILTFLLLLMIWGCNSSSQNNKSKNIDSIRQKQIDSSMAAADRPDTGEQVMSFEQVLSEELSSYNKIKKTDTTIIDGKDTLTMHFTYYCLHDSTLIVPKHYLWGGDTSKDFVTHNFVSKIILINNRDTVFDQIITKNDYKNALFVQLQKYATFIDDAEFNKYDISKKEFSFAYSISIPLTDVGVGVSLVINKNGNYRFLDEYDKVVKN